MELLNPLMLWGISAVAIPVILHLWHQKKGKLIHWAASQWLAEKKLQPSRGLKPDNLLLLILRVLMLVLLSLYLAKPLLKQPDNKTPVTGIHLVQPNKTVKANFKFEIEEALKKGEQVFWLNEKAGELKSFSELPDEPKENDLQTAFNALVRSGKIKNNPHLELYIANEPALSEISQVFVPDAFTIHTVADTSRSAVKSFLETTNGQKLFIDASGLLVSEPAGQSFEGQAVHSGPVKALISKKNKTEKQTLTAALKALHDVYAIDIQIDEAAIPQKKYDWVFDDLPPKNAELSTLYIISDAGNIPEEAIIRRPNVKYFAGKFDLHTSAEVFNGELPERLGELLLEHYGFSAPDKALSRQQLSGLFKTIKYAGNINDSWFSTIILLLFILIFGLERWIAIRKNA